MDTESFNLFRLVPGEWLERGRNFHTIDDSHASNKSVQYIEFARKIFPGFSSVATTFGTAGTWRRRGVETLLLRYFRKLSLKKFHCTRCPLQRRSLVSSSEYRIARIPRNIALRFSIPARGNMQRVSPPDNPISRFGRARAFL